MPAVDSNKHGQSEIGKEGERERADSLFLASLAAFLLPAERASGEGGRAAIGRIRRTGGRRIYEHEAVSNVRTNERAELPFGRTELQREEEKGRAEANGLLELLLAAMLLAACHCEAGGERMWSVTIFVQDRQTVDRPVAGFSNELVKSLRIFSHTIFSLIAIS